MTKGLGWVLAPMLALAVVSLRASDDHTNAKRASDTASSSRLAPGVARAAGHTATILVSAWHADNTPIKGANLRLRNVVSGKIEAVAKANDAGQFTFENVEGGSYAVELISDSGHVQTVGHVFTIAPGETVATFVRLPPKLPWASAVFNNTVGDIATTAATVGIAAIRPTGQCQSPPCH